jgi:hypothetical protein
MGIKLNLSHQGKNAENSVLRRIFGTKEEGVTGGWRKLQNEKVHLLYSSWHTTRIIKSKRIRWRDVACMGDKRKAYEILFRKPDGKTTSGTSRHRWVNNI